MLAARLRASSDGAERLASLAAVGRVTLKVDPWPGTLDADLTAVQGDELLGDRQAEAGLVERWTIGFVGLEEAAKELRLLLWREPQAVVADGDLDGLVNRACRNPDVAAVRRVLVRVRHQVRHDLRHAVTIRPRRAGQQIVRQVEPSDQDFESTSGRSASATSRITSPGSTAARFKLERPALHPRGGPAGR